jgi:hypothetical protein
MFVRAASRRVSGLTSRLTGRGLVVAAARFSGANGDDHVRRDPQVEFFGGDESEAPFAAAAGGAAGAGAGRAPGGTRGGGWGGTHEWAERAETGGRAPPRPRVPHRHRREARRSLGGLLRGIRGEAGRRALRAQAAAEADVCPARASASARAHASISPEPAQLSSDGLSSDSAGGSDR